MSSNKQYPPIAVKSYPPSAFQSQKAIGIQALQHVYYGEGPGVPTPAPYLAVYPATVTAAAILLARPQLLKFNPMFVRPCPITPRHGFVESRVVSTPEQLQTVIDETFAADPEGEIMLMNPINAKYNAVWVPSCLTWGKGHDGATAGKNTQSIPLGGKVDHTLPFEEAGIKPDQDPYVEVVYDPPKSCLTQLRAGPKLVGVNPDYIPVGITVKEVITVDPTSDLLAWESLIQAASKRPGVAIYHPGGSLTDHFSVHARTFFIPVLTTFEPKVGDVLVATLDQPPELEPAGVLEGLEVGNSFFLKHESGFTPNGCKEDATQATNMLLHALHNSGVWGGSNSWLFGVGVAFMLRVGSTALKGEARHLARQNGGSASNRNMVYCKTINHTLCQHRAATPRLIQVFRYGKFMGSVGGIKWAQCGLALGELFDAVGELSRTPTTDSLNQLVRVYNRAVNQAHNGGWWLNKFIHPNAMNEVQAGSLKWTLPLVPFLDRLFTHRSKMVHVTNHRSRWAKWKAVEHAPLNPTSAEVITQPGTNVLLIEVKNRFLKHHHRSIPILVDDLKPKLTSLLRGKLSLEATPSGLVLIMTPPHEPPIQIWAEKAIKPQ